MMLDAARAIQTIRFRAREWNIDPRNIACYGSSAGAGISLWLAFHDDLADSESDDPIARQSTRIRAAGAINGQSTYDMRIIREWFDIPELAPHPALFPFLGVKTSSDWDSDVIKTRMADASPITHLSEDDDAPVYMVYSRPNQQIDENTAADVWVHDVKMGLKLQEEMANLGLSCVVRGNKLRPDNDPYGSLREFIVATLTSEAEMQRSATRR